MGELGRQSARSQRKRLQVSYHRVNLVPNLYQGLVDEATVAERYRQGEIGIHIHMRIGSRRGDLETDMLCVYFQRVNNEIVGVGDNTIMRCVPAHLCDCWCHKTKLEQSVFVRVAVGLKKGKRIVLHECRADFGGVGEEIPTMARLEFLDCCPLRGTEVSNHFAVESLGIGQNRKLRGAHRVAPNALFGEIRLRQFPSHVVERRSEVLEDIGSDEHPFIVGC